MTSATAEPTRPAVTTAVLVLGNGTSPVDAAALARRFMESLDRTLHYPTVLAGADLEREASHLLDALRSEGVPVMVARPLRGCGGFGSIATLLELVFWLRSADAKVVHIAADDARLAREVSRARRFVRGIESVVEVPRAESTFVVGGLS